MSNLSKHFKTKLVPQLKKTLGYDNVMQVPKIEKITINMGLGTTDKKIIAAAVEELQSIAGQKPIVTRTKLSVAGFRIRQDWPIGCKVTLRGENMYHFLERLVDVSLPRVRDFMGLSPKSFDGRGNYSFGLKEQIVFVEVDYDKVDTMRGMDICVTTSARNDHDALELLKAFKFPFRGMAGQSDKASPETKQ